MRDWGVTGVRLVMGLIVLVAGTQKWMRGIGAVAAGFEKIPIPVPWPSALFISSLELIGGILLLLGAKTRWLGLLFAIEHTVTAFWVKFRLQGWNDGRLELMRLAAGLMLFLSGPGKLALDRD